MAYRFYREGNRRTQEIEAAKQDMASKNSEIQINDYYLAGAQSKLDYYQQIDSIHQLASQAFENLKSKYSGVQAEPGEIIYRWIPTVLDHIGQSKIHYRFSIPDQPPVFLRWAVAPAQSPPKRRTLLDQYDWLPAERVGPWRPGEVQLDPGLHDLVVITDRNHMEGETAWIEIRLDDSVAIKADTTLEGGSIRSSWRSPQEQRRLRFDKKGSKKYPALSQKLGSIDLESSSPNGIEVFFWLSDTPMPDVFSSNRSEGETSD